MENKKIYNDDVEAVTGNPDRKSAINAKYDTADRKKQGKMAKKIVFCATACALFGLMGVMGWAVPWIATPFSVFFGMESMFNAGRWYENGKLLGWK
jgi:hypothetical protein